MVTCHTQLSVGSIISWVPRPNRNAPTNVYFNNDTWIECNGILTCKTGPFMGQFCSDLTDRVLVGAGKLGQRLDIKDASLPDHAHRHTHNGSQTFKLRFRTGPQSLGTGKQLGVGSGSLSEAHDHDFIDTTFAVDFGKTNISEAFISRITNPKITQSTAENDLYSPHMRVKFMFKCY